MIYKNEPLDNFKLKLIQSLPDFLHYYFAFL